MLVLDQEVRAMPAHVDEQGRKRWTRIVYVIDLEPAACEDRKAPCGGDCPRKPIYVGETAFDADERFVRHKARKGGSRWVRLYGWRVNMSLASHLGEFATTRESEAAEQALAAELDERGYCVRVGPIRKTQPGRRRRRKGRARATRRARPTP